MTLFIVIMLLCAACGTFTCFGGALSGGEDWTVLFIVALVGLSFLCAGVLAAVIFFGPRSLGL